jgi:hypothetical protein
LGLRTATSVLPVAIARLRKTRYGSISRRRHRCAGTLRAFKVKVGKAVSIGISGKLKAEMDEATAMVTQRKDAKVQRRKGNT